MTGRSSRARAARTGLSSRVSNHRLISRFDLLLGMIENQNSLIHEQKERQTDQLETLMKHTVLLEALEKNLGKEDGPRGSGKVVNEMVVDEAVGVIDEKEAEEDRANETLDDEERNHDEGDNSQVNNQEADDEESRERTRLAKLKELKFRIQQLRDQIQAIFIFTTKSPNKSGLNKNGLFLATVTGLLAPIIQNLTSPPDNDNPSAQPKNQPPSVSTQLVIFCYSTALVTGIGASTLCVLGTNFANQRLITKLRDEALHNITSDKLLHREQVFALFLLLHSFAVYTYTLIGLVTFTSGFMLEMWSLMFSFSGKPWALIFTSCVTVFILFHLIATGVVEQITISEDTADDVYEVIETLKAKQRERGGTRGQFLIWISERWHLRLLARAIIGRASGDRTAVA
ncbi:hypothetical protein SISNIDRAFT_469516 [Sistotremastrum niveocremeum HHB9708]|uniref:DUF6535 domain-containing protein n=1 Tax=Sistotremastrum niveocremeum HHB9708 TaxID=1314777 RepID=A0A164Q1N6_9AGAM|nr:hypothetical protein SISNIDRAFT_469516 [Sistotremastrum niveocremeum HHB9708]